MLSVVPKSLTPSAGASYPALGAAPGIDLDLLPPEELAISSWRSLAIELADRISREELPPLELTSQPVDIGILFGDLIALPWYRTVFSNLGDVISPELGPPLELTSRPVYVGELVGDSLAHGWWTSLAGNVRDTLTRGSLPALRLTSQPVSPGGPPGWLNLPQWSSVIDGPKYYTPPAAPAARALPSAAAIPEGNPASFTPVPANMPDPELVRMQNQLQRDLRFARFREVLWVSVIASEVAGLVFVLLRAG